MNKHTLQINFTSLFAPAISDGPLSVDALHNYFSHMTQGLNAFKEAHLMGYAHLPFDQQALEDVMKLRAQLQGYRQVVVFGIGGSALGAQSIYYALRGAYAQFENDQPRLFVLDHIEPLGLLELCDTLDIPSTVFILISKSGDTSETLAQYLALLHKQKNITSEQVVIITDPQKGFLREFSKKQSVKTLSVPPEVGGRFSVFSAVGLLPLSLVGVDIEALIQGAQIMQKQCERVDLNHNPAAIMAVSWYRWFKEKNMSQLVMMPYSDRLRYVSDWFAQLFGESLGKQGLGFTPIKALGVTDQHSQLQLYLEGPRDKVTVFLDVENYRNTAPTAELGFQDDRIEFLSHRSLHELMRAEKMATEECLRENHRPNQTITLSELNEKNLGQLYQLFMNVVPMIGAIMGINPFDQPAVERIKKLTFGLMGRKGFENEAGHFKNTQHNPKIVYTSES